MKEKGECRAEMIKKLLEKKLGSENNVILKSLG